MSNNNLGRHSPSLEFSDDEDSRARIKQVPKEKRKKFQQDQLVYFIDTSGNYEGPYVIADSPSDKKYILSHKDGTPARNDEEVDEDKLVAVANSSP